MDPEWAEQHGANMCAEAVDQFLEILNIAVHRNHGQRAQTGSDGRLRRLRRVSQTLRRRLLLRGHQLQRRGGLVPSFYLEAFPFVGEKETRAVKDNNFLLLPGSARKTGGDWTCHCTLQAN